MDPEGRGWCTLYRRLQTLEAPLRSAQLITKAKQSETPERPITEALEESQVTGQPPPSDQGLLVHFESSPSSVSFPSKTELDLSVHGLI